MLVAFWGVKGGVGTTVTAALCALTWAAPGREVLLVDLGGDLPAALGCAPPSGPGCADWLAGADDADPATLGRLEIEVGGGVTLLARGEGALEGGGAAELFVEALSADPRLVLVDCGPPIRPGPFRGPAELAAERATHSWLVVRACYLALSHAARAAIRPSGVVLLAEPGRALDRTDVAAALDSSVVLELAVDQGVARSVDAGLLRSRLPPPLRRVLVGQRPSGQRADG